jgi:hypothetical protein
MTGTIVRLFDDASEAIRAAERLEAMGVKHHDLSLVANNREGWYDEKEGIQRRRDLDDDDRDHEGNKAGEGMATGAGTGGVIGAGTGLLAGLGMLAIPGLGPVVAAGWLAATAAGAAMGAVAGGLVGGIVGALTKEGVSEEDAEVYAEGVRRGGALLLIRNADRNRREVEMALDDFDSSEAAPRRTYYQESGWQGYDPDAPELTPAEIDAERARAASYYQPRRRI